MGRLFWKFFVVFWLAQVLTSAGVGLAIWFEHPSHGPGPHADMRPPPPPGIAPGERPPPPPHGGPPPHRGPLPVLPLVAGSIVSVLFAALLAWYFASPIRSLRGAFDAVASGRLDTRIGNGMRGRNDELADLGSDFDRMAERLQSLLDSQRRLLHDVSHELRSPLARLQAAADLMRQQPERSAEFIGRIERDTTRMDTLVGELLTLARLDAGIASRLDDAVDIGELIETIADDARVEADAKHCRIELELADTEPLQGNHELLHRAVENVVRNAVRHAPDGSAVSIRSSREQSRLHIDVADRGPGVFDADLDAIFAPFFRHGTGRSDGYGLGLAITRQVAQAHGGSASARNRPGGGLVVTLELPLDRAE